MGTYDDESSTVRGYRWVPGKHVHTKLICDDSPHNIAAISGNPLAQNRWFASCCNYNESRWGHFDTLEDAKHWCEMMINTGAI